MNLALVDKVVQAVLYEGYILYPYRASAKKDRQHFTFGRIYPEAYHVAQNGAEPCVMQTQCMAEGSAARLNVTVRFLHPMARDIGLVTAPLRHMPDPDLVDFFQEVPELEIDGTIYQACQEVVERAVSAPATVSTPALALACLAGDSPMRFPFFFSGSHVVEPIRNSRERIAGVIVRRQEAISGMVEIGADWVGDSAFKITVRILNQTAMNATELDDQESILMRTFASAHTILQIEEGEFISAIDPPSAYAEAASACQNIGTWPILVGDETKKERDTMVSSPVILYDYPQITPESPDDLFDADEIDEILTMTDEDVSARKPQVRDENPPAIPHR